jgi:hypothetical protein
MVQHPDAAARNRPHGKFLLPRNSKFPDEKDVKIGVQGLSYFESDRYTTSRECEYNQIRVADDGFEPPGQESTRFKTVTEKRFRGTAVHA